LAAQFLLDPLEGGGGLQHSQTLWLHLTDKATGREVKIDEWLEMTGIGIGYEKRKFAPTLQ